ncbi:restriction endonuclease subunit S [Candidatus Neomarinimicrobiota bacterium]
MSDWTRTTIGNLGHIVTGKTPPTAQAGNFGNWVPFITPRDMDGRKTITETERYLSEQGVKAVYKALIPAGAVMVSCIGSDMGKVAISASRSVTNQQINSVVVSKGHSHQFVYYNLSKRKEELRNAASGSAQPILNKRNFGELEILAPPLPEQHAIAHILGTLDDKIEINRRMNGTLEALAQAIFKSWFVDFDPVRAKMAGRQPYGMETDTAALFPDRLVDSGTDLGMIPEGWEVKAIGDVAQTFGGTTPSTKKPEFWEGGTNYFCTPKDMSTLNSPIILETERQITESGVDAIGSGQLPAGVVLMSSRAPVGYLAISQVPVSVNQGIIAMVCESTLSNYYIFSWAHHNLEMIKANANGSTFMEISKRNFRPLPIIDPGQDLAQMFNTSVANLYEKIVLNLRQSLTLTSLRDTLLPKLMSGELRVGEAEEMTKGE